MYQPGPLWIHNCNDSKNCNPLYCRHIKEIPNIRYLGVVIDNNLRWNLHINNVVVKLRSILYTFVKLRGILPLQTIQNVYFAFYQSIFQ